MFILIAAICSRKLTLLISSRYTRSIQEIQRTLPRFQNDYEYSQIGKRMVTVNGGDPCCSKMRNMVCCSQKLLQKFEKPEALAIHIGAATDAFLSGCFLQNMHTTFVAGGKSRCYLQEISSSLICVIRTVVLDLESDYAGSPSLSIEAHQFHEF